MSASDRRALGRSTRGARAVALWSVLALVVASCAPRGGEIGDESTDTVSTDTVSTDTAQLLVDVAREVGIDAVHVAGREGAYRMHEIHGVGAAFFDADGDGDLDLFLPQGNRATPDPTVTDRLFRNDRAGDVLHFVDVTAASGLGSSAESTGAAAGDYDNDGDVDLYVTSVAGDRLWRNRGDGTFDDATVSAGLGTDVAWTEAWTVGASWTDVDRDGRLDLYVVAYLEIPPGAPASCPSPSGEPDYCGPVTYRPLADRLWRNRGDGTFEDASRRFGVAQRRGSGLGVVSLDVDDDGWLDLFVANDKMSNLLWRNVEGRRFEESAVETGAAVNADGVAEAGMGIDAADLDGDGDEDVAIAHLAGETHTIYRNGGGWFVDDGRRLGLESTSRAATGFGLAWVDLDLDGRLDLVSVHGHVHRLPELAEAGDPFPYHQPDGVWLARSEGSEAAVLAPAGAVAHDFTARRQASRGLAVGDVDDDGDLDLVVTGVDAPVALWLNRTIDDRATPDPSWLGLRLVTGGRDALGALAILETATAETATGTLTRRARTDGSYGSSRDPRIVFGLGARAHAHEAVAVEVRWVSGRRERFAGLAVDRYHALVEGTGVAVEGGS